MGTAGRHHRLRAADPPRPRFHRVYVDGILGPQMAKAQKSSFVCQNCGAVSPRWAGKCAACGEWNTIVEEADAAPPPGSGSRDASARPRRHARGARQARPTRRRASRPACRARPRHRRRHRAGLGAADRRRARHRQVDAAAAARGRPRPRRPPRHLLLGRGGRRAGAAAGRAPRARGSRRGARLRDQPRQHPGDARPTRSAPISSSSIRSRRCGPTRSRRRPAP